MFENYPDVISIKNLCEMLHIGKSNAYSLLQNNDIYHVKVGRKYIIPKNAVIGFLGGICYNNQQIINGGLKLVTKGDIAQ